jgi:heterotetrameric sarcosine oxidase gamma subunit
MSEPRRLPLKSIVIAGRHGANTALPGVTLRIVHPVFLVSVIARKGQADKVRTALEGAGAARVMWAGPDQYFVQSDTDMVGALTERLGKSASIIDQSHGRVVIELSGPRVRDLLAKGSPVDVHSDQFPIGKSALTQMAHVSVHLTRTAEDVFILSLFRGFSESFWEWLQTASAEFGYSVI